MANIVASLVRAWRRGVPGAPCPRILQRAQEGRGSLDVVVVLDDANVEPSEGALPALLQRGAHVGRRMIVRVLPEGSPCRDTDAACRQLCRFADAGGTPASGVAVLFGASEAAVRRFAIGADYDVVLHVGSEPNPEVRSNRVASRRRPIAA